MISAKRHVQIVLSVLIVIIMWGALIMPSSFFPYWCYLDDASSLLKGQSLADDLTIPIPDDHTGRYMPAYWLYYGLLFKLFGFNLYGYYIMQSVMFLIIFLLIYLLTLKATSSIKAGLLAAFLAVTASPVTENAYTFGKAEPKMLFYLLLAIYVFVSIKDKDKIHSTFAKIVSWFSITFLLFVAVLTKETAIAFIVFALAGTMLSFMFRKGNRLLWEPNLKFYTLLLISSSASIMLARSLFYALRPLHSSNEYTTYPVNVDLILSNLKFYAAQQPDVLLVGLVAFVLLAYISIRKGGLKQNDIAFAFIFFLMGLSYLAGLLIWKMAFGYYLLVPAASFSISCAIVLWKINRLSKCKAIVYVALIIIVLTRIYAMSYSFYIAYAQKAQDKIYSEAVETYVHNARNGERLFVEQWPSYAYEPVFQSNRLIKHILGREELEIIGTRDVLKNIQPSPHWMQSLNLKTLPDQLTRPPKKNDYILIFTGDRQSHVVLRGVSPFKSQKDSVYKKKGYKLENVASDEVKWAGVDLKLPLSFPSIQSYSAGYQMYKVVDYDPNTAVENINILNNADFKIWSKGNSFRSPDNGQITVDNWATNSNGKAIYTVAREKNKSKDVVKIDISESKGTYIIDFFQAIKNREAYKGKELTMTAKIRANRPGIYAVILNDDSETVGSSFNNGTDWETLTYFKVVSDKLTYLNAAIRIRGDAPAVVYIDSCKVIAE